MSESPPPPKTIVNDALLRDFAEGRLDSAMMEKVAAFIEKRPQLQAKVEALSDKGLLNQVRGAQDQNASPASVTSQPAKVNRQVKVEAPASDSAVPVELANYPAYEIIREIGRGGMGVVYLAKNVAMDRLEVLKVLSDRLVANNNAKQRFMREVRSISKLNHPTIAISYSMLPLQSQLVMAMEYVPGIDLHKYIHQYQPVSIQVACSLAQQIAMGLQHGFEKGLVHRDIKPSNVMVYKGDGRLQVKILDFGLAKANSEKESDGLTRDGTMLGTPEYMSPEQILNSAKADIRSDIYSLGCTLYHMFAGHAPFRGTMGEVMMAQSQREPDRLQLKRPEIPVELEGIVSKLMAKDPTKRYQSPRQVSEALLPFTSGTPASSSNQAIPVAPETLHNYSSPAKDTSISPEVSPNHAKTSSPPPDALVDFETLLSAKKGPLKKVGQYKGRKKTTPNGQVSTQSWFTKGRIRVAAGIACAGMFLAWMLGIISIETPNGTIVIERMPKDAFVKINGKKVIVTSQKKGLDVEISIPPGEKRVEVIHNNKNILGDKDGQTVRLQNNDRIVLKFNPESTAELPRKPAIPHSNTITIKSRDPIFKSIDFSKPIDGRDFSEKDTTNHSKQPDSFVGISEGRFIVNNNLGNSWWANGFCSNSITDTIILANGRVLGEADATWGIDFSGIVVGITADAKLRILPSFRDDQVPQPIRECVFSNSSIRRSPDFNELAIVLKGNLLCVFVNDKCVVIPRELPFVSRPSFPFLATLSENARCDSELDSIFFYPTEGIDMLPMRRISGLWRHETANGLREEIDFCADGAISVFNPSEGLAFAEAENAGEGYVARLAKFDCVHKYILKEDTIELQQWNPATAFETSPPSSVALLTKADTMRTREAGELGLKSQLLNAQLRKPFFDKLLKVESANVSYSCLKNIQKYCLPSILGLDSIEIGNAGKQTNIASSSKWLYCIHPFNMERPATIDFGQITKSTTGVLRIFYRTIPPLAEPANRTHSMRIKKDNIEFARETVHESRGWLAKDIPFNHESILLEHYAEAWNMEYGLYDYELIFLSQPSTTNDGQAADDENQSVGQKSVPMADEPSREWKTAMTKAKEAIVKAEFDTFHKQIDIALNISKSAETQAKQGRLDQMGQLYAIFIAAVRSVSNKAPNASFEVGKTRVAIVASNDEDVTLRILGKNERYSWTKLPPGIALALADLVLSETDPTDIAARAVYFRLSHSTNELSKMKVEEWFKNSLGKGQIRADLDQAFEDNYE
jgi:serine/threonine protein kinase